MNSSAFCVCEGRRPLGRKGYRGIIILKRSLNQQDEANGSIHLRSVCVKEGDHLGENGRGIIILKRILNQQDEANGSIHLRCVCEGRRPLGRKGYRGIIILKRILNQQDEANR